MRKLGALALVTSLGIVSAAPLNGVPRAFTKIVFAELGVQTLDCGAKINDDPKNGGWYCGRSDADPARLRAAWNAKAPAVATRMGLKLIAKPGYSDWKTPYGPDSYVRWYSLAGYDFTLYQYPKNRTLLAQSDDAFDSPKPASRPAVRLRFDPSGPDRDCGDFTTRAEAQAFFAAAGSGDPHGLDRDRNGLACETLP